MVSRLSAELKVFVVEDLLRVWRGVVHVLEIIKAGQIQQPSPQVRTGSCNSPRSFRISVTCWECSTVNPIRQ